MDDLEILKLEIKNISKHINENMNRIENIDRKVSELYNELVGNESFGRKGLAARITTLEQENEKIVKNYDMIKNKAIGFSAAFAAVITFVYELIKIKFFSGK